MKLIKWTCGLLLLASNTIYAKHVNTADATNVAQNFLNHKSDARNDVQLIKTYSNTEGTPTFYIFELKSEEGFVIVAADDLVTPIIGYSLDNSVKVDNMPDHIAYWYNGISNEIANVIKYNTTTTEEIQAKWASLIHNQFNTSGRTEIVAPLVKSKWDQWPVFNDLTPLPGVSLSSTPIGCVATAMAQIMKYWDFPKNGKGARTYNHGEYGVLSSNFEEHYYEWSKMPLTISSMTSEAAKVAVADFLYDCAISVEMDFDKGENGGSGAFTVSYDGYFDACAQNAFVEHFRYRNDIKEKHRYDTSPSAWITILKAELDAGRPMLYSGFGDSGGHAWVVDGYDDEDMFHCNWGWRGSSDGYYFINSMNPPALGAGGGGGGFNDGQSIVYNIIPSDTTNSITDEMIAKNISVYPNPATNVISVLAETSPIQNVILYDISGRMVMNQKENSNNVTINVSGLARGIYMIKVTVAEGTLNQKVVLQ